MTTLSVYTPEQALRYCRAVTRRRARNFYYGLKLLPEPQRSQLYAVYAWMRRADDITDEARDPDRARERVAELRAATGRALAGRAPDDDPVLVGLRTVAGAVALDPAPFDAMLDGQIDDLDGRVYERFEDLSEYCYRVASTVGLICIRIWGYDDERAPMLAIKRGIALQLTNILRDYVEDHAAGRVYLPAEDFRRHELTPTSLRDIEDPARCVAFLAAQIERAESYYERSAGLEAMITPACRPTCWAMTTIYRRLLARMREHPTQVLRGPRVRLSPIVKSSVARRARWRARAMGLGRR